MDMSAINPRPEHARKSTAIAVTTVIAAAALGSFALIGHLQTGADVADTKVRPPETVAVAPISLAYRAAGEFSRHGVPVDAPLIDVGFEGTVHVMKYQVSVADYARCVDAGACAPADVRATGKNSVALTGVSYVDALNYASWLSDQTGQVWRLPTDEEWVLAAGSRFADDALGLGPNAGDPSKRWLAKYRRNAELSVEYDGDPKPPGHYGENEHGISDLSGNIWEWTSTCYVRANVSSRGDVEEVTTTNCGVRVVEGRHRSYMTDFVRDAKSGGCAVGTPPDNLGFRLVRENTHAQLLISALQDWWRGSRTQ